MFGCMIMNGALLLLVRSVSTALLAILGRQWVMLFYGCDLGLYFMYRVLRGDFLHWIGLEGGASFAVSVLERGVVKILVDFTGLVQLRGAGEMGGCYWTFNMVRDTRERDSPSPSNQVRTRRSWRLPPRSSPPTSTTRTSVRRWRPPSTSPSRGRSWEDSVPGGGFFSRWRSSCS